MSDNTTTEAEKKLAQLEQILIELQRNYKPAIREAWLEGFEKGAKAGSLAVEYKGKHYANSDTYKGMKVKS